MLASEWRRTGRTQARLTENGQVHAYVRYPDSLPGSLSGIWNMGIATPRARIFGPLVAAVEGGS